MYNMHYIETKIATVLLVKKMVLGGLHMDLKNLIVYITCHQRVTMFYVNVILIQKYVT